MSGDEDPGMSILEHLAGLLMYGWPVLLLTILVAAIVGLAAFLTLDYVRDRRRQA